MSGGVVTEGCIVGVNRLLLSRIKPNVNKFHFDYDYDFVPGEGSIVPSVL